ncbi:sushi, von Willebrand factor type A, EGF and pentraxin domain-containing protein 1-like [Gigantopelta aegis]|uniref:sushi, von Willebrand factor type A, EGF and pentraxin domain-containing protein 1-like n=1 Tax=Gigantopelta aegis TaxID=1735272 RepID=UPI001B88ACDA|nr:sushi, von Willebrand factor type A, EGF and pentraxin domain-containing protein 1-like [Gigantopelta aegis]
MVRHGLPPGRLFSEPVTTMRYTAQDDAGNMATCSFDIHVKVIRCTPPPPRVNNGYRICHLGTDYRLGSDCRYGCYEGYELTGASSKTIKCLDSGRWSGSFPTCKKLSCRRLPELSGMTKHCTDGSKVRSICTYSCTQPGYDILPGRRRAFVCQANKRWSGDPSSVTCKDMEPPKFKRVLNAIAFADKGSTSTTVEFMDPPEVEDNSSPANIIPVQVKGQKSKTRFSVGVHLIEFHAVDGAGNKAKPLKFKIIVKELVCHTLYRTAYQTVICEEGYRYGSPCYFFCDDNFALVGTANVTCERMGSHPYLYGAWTFGSRHPSCILQKKCPPLRAPDNGAMVCDTWFGGQFCQFMCRNGIDIPRTFKEYQLFHCGNTGIWNLNKCLADKIPNCVNPCDKGSFHDVTNSTCNLCAKGEYQDTEGQTTCLQCPSGHTTAGKGAADISSCQEACAAGSVSRTGISPYTPCELSTYQPQVGQSTCRRCAGSMTTISQGAVSVSECAEFDLELEPSNTSVAQASLELDNLVLGDSFVMSWWLRILYSNETRLLTVLGETHVDWLLVTVNDSSCITVNRYRVMRHLSSGIELHNLMTCDLIVLKLSTRDSFVGSVSQFNIWSGSEMLPQQPTCRSGKSGDKLSWRKFVNANLTESAVSLPGECDDFDNCASNPCHHGNCTDGLHSFDCECYHGYEGTRCETNIDDCLENVCEHNGTCVDQAGGFSCNCTDLFTGDLCEIAVVHGGWADWEDWSTCSVSCGQGVRTRKRSCTNPTPDNGGRECDSLDTEQEVCNETVCPVCKEISAPANGSVLCENSTTFINCTMDCDEGYLPDIEPLSSYYCGEQTGHIWNFETEQNPHRRLPFCSKTHNPETLSATYNIKYRNLRCGKNEAAMSIVRDHVTRLLQSDVTCVTDAKCDIDDVSVGCSVSMREKRDVSEESMGFTVTLRNNGDGPESGVVLESAMHALQDHAQVGSFTVNISGVLYHVDVNQTDVYGDVTCPEGMASYSYFCVPCGHGSFLSSDLCMLCGYGTYQDKPGQTACDQCPDGWTTDGVGSRDVSDCSVEQLSTKHAVAISLSVIVVLGTVIVIIIVILVRRFGRNAAYKLNQRCTTSDAHVATPILEMNEKYIQYPTTVSRQDAKLNRNQHGKKITQPLLQTNL